MVMWLQTLSLKNKASRDKQKDIALGAWLTFVASAKKKVGKNLKPVYPTFDSFFD